MSISSSQEATLVGGTSKNIALNGDYTYTQITITGRNTGVVTARARPLLSDNSEASFQDADFEVVSEGTVDLAASPPKRTFTITDKRLSAIRLIDAGTGPYQYIIRQWNRANQ